MPDAVAEWKFKKRDIDDVEHEVTESDQLNNETVQRVEALVREAVQNSQDAAASSGPVRVRIALIQPEDGLDVELLEQLTSEVRARMKAAGLTEREDAIAKHRVLVVEDFETEGLTGDVTSDEKSNWRSFFYAHGGSNKGSGKDGRWGLGKLVFPMFSATRCMFGLTLRAGDAAPLVLGQAVLRTHRIEGAKFAPHGHYGHTSSGQHRPVVDADWVARFRKGFGLTRVNERGLSVVVPYPLEGASQDALLRYVVHNYAYPILLNRLVVDVLGKVVDATSVREIGKEVLDPEFIEFVETLHTEPEENLHQIESKSGDEYGETQLQPKLEDLRKRYAAGELVGFRMRLRLRHRIKGERDTFVDIFLKAASTADKGEALFVRGSITVPGEAKRKFRAKGAFAALVAPREQASSDFLADAENPAHTDWSAQAARLGEKWIGQDVSLRRIRNAPENLHRMLASGMEEEHETSLLDVFYVLDPAAPHKGGHPQPKKKQNETGTVTAEIPKPKPPRLNLSKRSGGFEVTAGPSFSEVTLPAEIVVRVAYDVEGGNPFKTWDRLDFEFGAKKGPGISITDGKVEFDGNRIIARVDSANFRLGTTGFDVRRDLIVDVRIREGGDLASADQ